MNKEYNATYNININGNIEERNFEYCIDLSMLDKVSFVKNVVNTVIDDNDYNHVWLDLIFNFVIVTHFTNISEDDVLINEGNFINDIEQFLNNSDIIKFLLSVINIDVLEELRVAVKLDIEYKTGIHFSKFDNLITMIEHDVKNINFDKLQSLLNENVGNKYEN